MFNKVATACFSLCIGLMLFSCKGKDNLAEGKPLPPPPRHQFFRIDARARNEMPKRTRVLLEHAEQDMGLIAEGKQPIWCKRKSISLDGGTGLYGSDDYDITSWHQLRNIDGYMFIKCGISIRFIPKFSVIDSPEEDLEYTWLTPDVMPPRK